MVKVVIRDGQNDGYHTSFATERIIILTRIRVPLFFTSVAALKH